MQMKRFLITGGCGFIGSNFIRFFLKTQPDVSLINLDKLTYAGLRQNIESFESDSRYEFVHGDICDRSLVEQLTGRVDEIVHFAAETHVDRSIDSSQEFIKTNVLGTGVLLEAARKANCKRFIHFSTDEVYGSRKNGSFSEMDPLEPSSPYSASKAGGDLLALSYWKTHRLPVIVLRCSNNFGQYQFPEKVIPLFITNLIEGKKLPLYGTGANVRDWLYVEDCVRAVAFILEHGQPGEIYNIGGGSELTNLTLARMILKILGQPDEMIQYVPDRPAHDFRYSLNVSKIKKLGFMIQSRFGECLRETIRWYQENRSWWQPLKKDIYTLK